jgi:hypothetical protein
VGVPAAPAFATTEPDDGGSSDSDTTEPTGNGIETDPSRRDWLEFAEDADPETFAGGADAADLVDGNRVIMVGDSVMASTSSRYGGEMCDSVVEEGWDVEVDAETGRFIDFGGKVLDQRLQDDFDVAVIMLGNNYGADPGVYEDYLRDIVEQLEPRPIVLSTVSVFQANRVEVNDVIYEIARDFDNIRVLDWAGETADNPVLTGGDGLHLTDLGRARFADMVAEELGDAPGFGEGQCLRSSFTDDSAGTGNTGPIEGQVTMPPNVPTNPNPNPETTVPIPQPTLSTETTDGGGGGETTMPSEPPTETQPPATDPPVTVPPTEPPPPPTEPPTVPPTVAPTVTDPPEPGG